MNTPVFTIAVVGILVLINAIAFLRRGRIGFLAYHADPDQHNMLPIAFSMVGTVVGGGMFLGVGQIGYEAGVVGYAIGGATLAGLLFIAAVVPRLRELLENENCVNIVDLLETKYSPRVAILFSVVSTAIYLFLIAGQILAIYTVTNFLTPHISASWIPVTLLALGLISLFVYPILGGLRKDIVTDIVQVVIVIFAAAVLTEKMLADPVATTMWSTIPVTHLSGLGYGLPFLLGVVFFLPTVFIVRMDVWQRIRAGRDSRQTRMAFVVAAIVSCAFYVFFTTIGMWAYSHQMPSPTNATLDIVVLSLQDPLLLALVLGAFFAAVLSSADTFINNTSIFLARALRTRLWASHRTDPESLALLTATRWLAGGAIIAAILLAWASPNLVNLMVGALSLLLIFLPSVLGTFVERWRSERGAFYGSLLSFILFLLLFFGWNPKYAFVPSVVVAGVLHGVVARVESLGRADVRSGDR